MNLSKIQRFILSAGLLACTVLLVVLSVPLLQWAVQAMTEFADGISRITP